MGKVWNKDTENWEVDGVPCTYRVSWEDENGNSNEKIFKSVDAGYDYYKEIKAQYKKANWEHLPY